MKFVYLFLLCLLPSGSLSNSEAADQLTKYKELQNDIQGFLDGVWGTMTEMIRNDPRLSFNEDLMQAFNVMLSPMLVPANGSRNHAEAMSAFCYNYFEVGMLMTDDHIKQPVYSTGDTKVINQLLACEGKMKQLQGKCLTTLGVNLVSGLWNRVTQAIHGLIPV